MTDGAEERTPVGERGEEFWEKVGGVVFGEDQWAMAPVEVDAILGWVDAEPGDRVLDLACGTGRHALELAGRGYEVTGVDRTAAYLEEARERAEERGVAVDWREADMREFERPGGFELALLLYSSLGYFEAPEEDRRLLESVAESLVPGGEVVVEVVGEEVVADGFVEENWRQLDDGRIVLAERSVEGDWERLTNRWTVVDQQGGRETYELTFRLHSGSELRELLESAGFEDVRLYGGWDGQAYGEEANRLVAVGNT